LVSNLLANTQTINLDKTLIFGNPLARTNYTVRAKNMNTPRDRLIDALATCMNAGPAREDAIEQAESQLQLFFPPTYRMFLALFGASMGNGFEIHGLCPVPEDEDSTPLWSDVVSSTLALRPDCLPENSIEISHDGCEIGYFLECSTTDREFEGRIIEWGSPHDGAFPTGMTFIEFVESQTEDP